jgi:uncharacterized membrane protein
MIAALLSIHLIAATLWVGGLAFMLLVLRPALADLPGPVALGVMRQVLQRFLRLVWICVTALITTGYAGVFLMFDGFAAASLSIRIMHVSGMTMAVLFLLLWWGPWRRFLRHFDTGNFALAAEALRSIRRIAMVNLILGLFTACISVTGGFLLH